MKILFIFFMSFFLTPFLVIGQCTPDTTIKTPGVYPKKLPDATVNVAYNENIQFKFPKDTNYSGVTVPIDSARIDSVKLPVTFTYNCNNSHCTYLGGENGCANIKGNPVSGMAKDYWVRVYATAFVTFSGLHFPVQYVDSLQFTIKSAVGIRTLRPISQTYQFEIGQNEPNPFQTTTTFEYTLPEKSTVIFRVFDILGQEVSRKYMVGNRGENSFVMERNNFRAGLYFYSFQFGNNILTKRMIVGE